MKSHVCCSNNLGPFNLGGNLEMLQRDATTEATSLKISSNILQQQNISLTLPKSQKIQRKSISILRTLFLYFSYVQVVWRNENHASFFFLSALKGLKKILKGLLHFSSCNILLQREFSLTKHTLVNDSVRAAKFRKLKLNALRQRPQEILFIILRSVGIDKSWLK